MIVSVRKNGVKFSAIFEIPLLNTGVEIKKSVTGYFSHSIEEENKRNRNEIGLKMKTLEAKRTGQTAENQSSEKAMFTSSVLEAGAPGQI